MSTSGASQRYSLMNAVLKGLPEEGELFVPEKIPVLNWKTWKHFDFLSVAQLVLSEFLSDDFSETEISTLCKKSFNFPVVLRKIDESHSYLELFHGPTAAFKDVAARFLAELLGLIKIKQNDKSTTTILVATSGDTGGAVAAAFSGRPQFRVVILFPHQGVSPFQQQQLTCWESNIKSLAIEGTFDDAQRLVKSLLSKNDLAARYHLTSANSINIGRLLPQVCYYAASSLWWWNERHNPATYFIPTGNMGNAVAAFWAKAMGFSIDKIHMACNANETLSHFYKTGVFQPQSSIKTLANAMDVGNPSNWKRLQFLYPQFQSLLDFSSATSVSDEEIRNTIKSVYKRHHEVICPHTATAWCLSERQILENDASGIIVGTAHPAKFSEIIEPLLGVSVAEPESFKEIRSRPSQFQVIPPEENKIIPFLE